MKFSELKLNDNVLEALDAMRLTSAPPYKKNQYQLYSKAGT